MDPQEPQFPPGQHQHQGSEQQPPNPGDSRAGYHSQPTNAQYIYGVQQSKGIAPSFSAQDISRDKLFNGSNEENYNGDHDQEYDEDYEEDYMEDDWGSDRHGINLASDEKPPGSLTDDPIYQQTIQQVSLLRDRFNTSPKNDATAVSAIQPSLPKQKRSLEEAGDLDFDEREFEEAIHEAKRRRLGPETATAFSDAQKVFSEGLGAAQPSEPMDEDIPEFNGLDLDLQILGLGPEYKGVHDGAILSLARPPRSYGFQKPLPHPKPRHPSFHLLESVCSSFWLAIEVTKHLRVKDIVNLYSISRTFHGLINDRFQATITAWAEHMSPAGWKVFYWKFYGKYTIQDPSGLTWAAPGPFAFPRPAWDVKPRLASNINVRRVPSLKYLAMLELRETRTRDILACLARAGHRLPQTAHITLKKIWLLMDCATNAQRRGFIHNADLWTDRDLYNAQLFFVKLHMRFNEPIFGPNSPLLADTFLGSKDGLTPLWKLLRRKAYTEPVEVIQQRLRYWLPEEDIDHWRLIGGSGKTFWNVPPAELGEEHREGWGAGYLHMLRPDELVVEECVRREIKMEGHIIFMVFWGHIDFQRRRNLVPTEEEMYMSDEDDEPPLPAWGPFSRTGTFGRCGNVPFAYDDWQPKHAMKARWNTLTREEKQWVVRHDAREEEDALVYEEDGDGFWDDFNVNDYPDPEEEDRLEALRQCKPHLTDLERKVLESYNEKKAQGEEIDYADIVSLSGSSDSFFAPVIPTGEPELDPVYRAKMEEERKKRQQEEREREKQPIEYIYEDDEIPPIPDTVTDPETIANWNDMDPYLHKVVIEEHKRLELQARKDRRTRLHFQRQEEKRKMMKEQQQGEDATALASPSSSKTPPPPPPPRYHYNYPSITDPHLLSMLRRYDQFPPEAFGDQFPPSPEKKPHEDLEHEDWEDADDEGLQALGDVDYDSEELEFDVDKYQKFLDRVGGDNGRFRRRDIGEEDASGAGDDKKQNGKGKGKKAREEEEKEEEGEEREEEGDMTMAHEADVLDEDDDIPFPKYDFRHF